MMISEKKKGGEETPKKSSQSKRFCLTLHGATNDQLERITKFFDTDEVEFAIMARESGEHSIHPHFQGYFELKKARRMRAKINEILDSENFHLETAIGSRSTNLVYIYAVQKAYEIGWIVYSKGEHEIPRGYSSQASDFIKTFKPRPFQKQILEIIKSPADDRHIYWFWEPEGDTGKTAIAKYLHRIYGAITVGGRSADMKHALARFREIVGVDPSIVVIDIARIGAEHFKSLHLGIEDIKNGLFFSGKYDSSMLDMKQSVHVFVFSNSPPDVSTHSLDRWRIYRISSKTYEAKLEDPEKYKSAKTEGSPSSELHPL